MVAKRSEFSRVTEKAAILAVAPAMPANYVDQPTVIARLRQHWANLRRLDELQRAAMVAGRHFALSLSEYEPLDTFQSGIIDGRRWRLSWAVWRSAPRLSRLGSAAPRSTTSFLRPIQDQHSEHRGISHKSAENERADQTHPIVRSRMRGRSRRNCESFKLPRIVSRSNRRTPVGRALFAHFPTQ
jgi:hypothetical protein